MKAKLSIATVILFLGSANLCTAQLTAYANIYATVVAPVGISDLSNDSLGTIVVAKSPINTTAKSAGMVTVSGMQVAQNETATVASFSLTDYNNTTFDLTLPTSNINLSEGNNNLVASNFSHNYSLDHTLESGKKMIKIGAVLHLSDNLSANNYIAQNPFPVTLNYN